MVKYFLKSDLALKRWNRFYRRKTAVLSIWLLILATFFSCTAEMWANSRPVLMSFQGSLYFPSYKEYHPSEFGQEGVVTDYRALQISEPNWAIWPIIKWNPYETNKEVESFPAPPSKINLFGTDNRGRDVFTRLLYGFRYSMGYAIGVWMIVSLLGLTIGSIMGFKGGWVDLLGQRFIEILESMPWLLVLITLISIYSPSMTMLIVFTSLTGWIGISLYTRGEFLKLRRREFVEAARALGVSQQRIIFSHILPNSLTPWITSSPFIISGFVASLAALDFLGFGLKPPTPSWGELMSQAKDYFTIAWWLATWPSFALFMTLVVLNLIGEGVRDALDPRKS